MYSHTDTIGHAFGELDVHRLTILSEYAFFGRKLDVKCVLMDGRELEACLPLIQVFFFICLCRLGL